MPSGAAGTEEGMHTLPHIRSAENAGVDNQSVEVHSRAWKEIRGIETRAGHVGYSTTPGSTHSAPSCLLLTQLVFT